MALWLKSTNAPLFLHWNSNESTQKNTKKNWNGVFGSEDLTAPVGSCLKRTLTFSASLTIDGKKSCTSWDVKKNTPRLFVGHLPKSTATGYINPSISFWSTVASYGPSWLHCCRLTRQGGKRHLLRLRKKKGGSFEGIFGPWSTLLFWSILIYVCILHIAPAVLQKNSNLLNKQLTADSRLTKKQWSFGYPLI